jgi:hypothetical protein
MSRRFITAAIAVATLAAAASCVERQALGQGAADGAAPAWTASPQSSGAVAGQDCERLAARRAGPSPPVAPETIRPLCGRKVIVQMIFPVQGATRWRNGYNVRLGAIRHNAIDIAAPKMRPIVAPFSGIIGFKTQTFWIYGDNGYKCLGTHLNDDTPGTDDNRANPDYMFAPNLRRWDHVVAGQLIGYVGNSGKTTGPHLHFELFDRDGVNVNPFFSLKRAVHIAGPKPVFSAAAAGRTPGETRIVGCVRGWNASRHILAILAVARKTADGRTYASRTPTWYRISLPPEVVEQAGGDEALARMERDRTITVSIAEPRSHKQQARASGPMGRACRIAVPVDEPDAPSPPTAAAIQPPVHGGDDGDGDDGDEKSNIR